MSPPSNTPELAGSSIPAVRSKDARAYEKAEQQEKAWDLWLDCHTEQEVADAVDIARRTVSDWLSEKRKVAETAKPPDSQQHFDVWNFGSDG